MSAREVVDHLATRATATLEAIRWCRTHNARIRFESSGKVTVCVNGFTRRRETLVEAVLALQTFLAAGPRP